MIKLGITGGIGSGKTTVSKIFELFSVPVFYADIEAKNIMNHDIDVVAQVIETVGDVYLNGVLDRKKMADVIFSNPEKLKIINSIVHPAVHRYYQLWLESNSEYPITLMEAAILFERGTYKKMDKVITVFAPEDVRIKRVCERDNITPEKVRERINNQMSEEKKLELADFVIINDEKEMLISQVKKIIDQLT